MKETFPSTSCNLRSHKRTVPLSAVVLAALEDLQTTKVCPEGLELFLEGQLPAGIYILNAGRVKLSVTDNHGQQVTVGTALPGDILGLSAAVSGKCYEETAVAMIPCQIGFIKRKDFLSFLDRHPEAAFWVVQLLSDRVTTTLEQLSCLKRTPSSAVRQ